ncbi:MAPEG family protein [Thalassotalea piscium]
MTLLIWCLFITMLLPILSKMPVAYAQQQLGKYDNHNPRAQQATLSGFGARALAAHQNSFESLLFITPAILLALITNHTSPFIEQMAMLHVAARLCFHCFYLLNWSTLRSIVWFIGVSTPFIIVIQCLPG